MSKTIGRYLAACWMKDLAERLASESWEKLDDGEKSLSFEEPPLVLSDVNGLLLDEGLRLVQIQSRLDLVTMEEVRGLLRQLHAYRWLKVAADDVELPVSMWPTWRCDDGIYTFSLGPDLHAPPLDVHRNNVAAARRRKNDPDGILVNRPPAIMLVGDTIGGSGSRWVNVRQRRHGGEWELFASDSGFLRCWKDILAANMEDA